MADSPDIVSPPPGQWKAGAKAMAAFQTQHAATGASGKNQHHGSKAMTLKDVTTVCQKGAQHGLSHAFWFRPVNETYAIAGVTVYHESGESLSSEIGFNTEFKGARSREQALGSAKTYLHKYMLSGLYGLANDDADMDDDGENAVPAPGSVVVTEPKQQPKPAANPNKLTKEEHTQAINIIKSNDDAKAQFMAKFCPNADNLYPNMIELKEHLAFLTSVSGAAI